MIMEMTQTQIHCILNYRLLGLVYTSKPGTFDLSTILPGCSRLDVAGSSGVFLVNEGRHLLL